jgi:hypothetical protein
MVRVVPALVFAVVACLLLPACSSDTAAAPEAELDTPGAFIAVDEGKGGLVLHRMLEKVVLEEETFLFLTVYDVSPSTWDEAGALAKRHDLPVRSGSVPAPAQLFPSGPHRVVWFRTLTEEEAHRVVE